MEELHIGRTYELLEPMSTGGTVWQARHRTTGRAVAVKLFRHGLETAPEAIGRFLRDAQAAGRLEHPHVAQVLEAGLDPRTRTPYVVRELLPGVSLQRYLRRERLEGEGRLAPTVAASVVGSVLRGLAAMHQVGVVHGGLTPAHVILCRRPEDPFDTVTPKIIDFGAELLRSALGRRDEAGLDEVAYLSPEQAEGRRDLDAASDLWAVGVMLFEMVAGTRPFDADTVDGTLARIRSHEVPLGALGPEVSRGFAEVVSRALTRRPSARFLSALDMLESLEGAVLTPLRGASLVLPRVSVAALQPRDAAPEPPLHVLASETLPPAPALPRLEPASHARRVVPLSTWLALAAAAFVLGAAVYWLLRS
jgi:serine/threonine protein kinase